MAAQLMHILRAFELAARFQTAALRLARAHDSRSVAPMPTREASELLGQCGACLKELTELLLQPLPTAASSGGRGHAARLPAAVLPPPTEPHPLLLEALTSRRLLPLLAALLHVPALHRAVLEATGETATQAAAVEAGLQQQLALGAKPLLSLLCSSARGLVLLLGDPQLAEQLLDALEPGSPSDAAALLRDLVLAHAAVADLCSAELPSALLAPAVETAAGLLHEGTAARRALLLMVAMQSRQALPKLLEMAGLYGALLRRASGSSGGGRGSGSGDAGTEPGEPAESVGEPPAHVLAAAPACSRAGELLEALACSGHADLVGRWAQQAAAVQDAAAAQLASLEACTGAPAEALRQQLARTRGGAAAVVFLTDGGQDQQGQRQAPGVPALLAYLSSHLPAAVAAPAPTPRPAGEGRSPAPASAARRLPRQVDWAQAQQLFQDSQRLACCEQCLRLLATLLFAPDTGKHAALAAQAADALSPLLCALLTATDLVAAAQADGSWSALAGDTIDPTAAAANRQQALRLLEAAAAALSSFLQHMRG